MQKVPTKPNLFNKLLEWAKGNKKTLEDVIDTISKSQPELKCILERPEKLPVDTTLNWVGREKELEDLLKLTLTNVERYTRQVATKQLYSIPLVHGGMGLGKSRLGIELFRKLKELHEQNKPCKLSPTKKDLRFQEAFDDIAHVFIDFSTIDELDMHHEGRLPSSILLGLRVACHFFFGCPLDAIRLSSEEQSMFLFSNVLDLISKRHVKKGLLLLIQLDEFPHVDQEILNKMIGEISGQMISKHERKICVLPFLTGTATQVGVQAIKTSKMPLKSIPLLPLSTNEVNQLLSITLKPSRKNPLFSQAVDSLGGVPRFFQFFLEHFKSSDQYSGKKIQQKLCSVVEQIAKSYDTEKWNNLLHSEVGVRTMLLWALAGKEVGLKDMLNGISVEDARDTGILMLEPVSNSREKYTLKVPLALLRAINLGLNDIEDSYLDPIPGVDDRAFERAMNGLRLLRQKLFVKAGRKKATYRELYPHALGYAEDLDQEVNLKELQEVLVDGSSARHESIHKYPLDAIPVQRFKTPTVNAAVSSLLQFR